MNQVAFRGRHQHSLDEKGRLSIPSKFRETIAQEHDGRLIITNFPLCLVGYTPDQWSLIESRTSMLSNVKSNIQSFLRYFYSGATECEIDRQGRWDEEMKKAVENFDGISAELADLGL